VISRRTFLCGLTFGTVSVPLAAEAQQAGKVYRIGFLSLSSASDYAPLLQAFRQGLRDLGYEEGTRLGLFGAYGVRYQAAPDSAPSR
jgi:hypothetical protein